MITFVTRSATETRAAGAALAGVLRAGDLVLLSGELGAGKTTLVQGIGEAIGVHEPMTSPTFTLVRTYGHDPVLAHADVWRLERLREVLDLGLDELLDSGAIALVEWGDAVAEELGRDALMVHLEPVPSEGAETRRIAIDALGDSFRLRLEALEGRFAEARSR